MDLNDNNNENRNNNNYNWKKLSSFNDIIII